MELAAGLSARADPARPHHVAAPGLRGGPPTATLGRLTGSSALALAGAALTVGLVFPLALGPTTFDRRAAAVLLIAALLGVTPARRILTAVRWPAGAFVLGAACLALAATAPVAAEHERLGQADVALRTGERLVELNRPNEALPHLQEAARLDPEGPTAAALASLRRVDAIWNAYDWPETLAELARARAAQPDLPGLTEKLYAAEVSYGWALLARGERAAARARAEVALAIRPDGPEARELLNAALPRSARSGLLGAPRAPAQ